MLKKEVLNMIELICNKCNCLMPNDQGISKGYITFKCKNYDISVTCPNLLEFISVRKN